MRKRPVSSQGRLLVDPVGDCDEAVDVGRRNQREGDEKVFRQLHAFYGKEAAPDPPAALPFGILEDCRGKVAALDRSERLRQSVHPRHWDLQPGLLCRLQRAEYHIVVIRDDEIVGLVLGEDALRDRLPLAAIVVSVLLNKFDLVTEPGAVEIVPEAVVAGDISNLPSDATEIDASKFGFA